MNRNVLTLKFDDESSLIIMKELKSLFKFHTNDYLMLITKVNEYLEKYGYDSTYFILTWFERQINKSLDSSKDILDNYQLFKNYLLYADFVSALKLLIKSCNQKNNLERTKNI